MGRQVLVGLILGPHGIRGEVVVRRFGDEPGILEKGASIRGRKGPLEVSLEVQSVRPHKRDWVVVFEGVSDRNEAETLAGLEILVDEARLPDLPEGTYYNYQLLGLSVVTVRGENLGVIEEVLETGANDVAVVMGERGEVLLPLIGHVIRAVDLEKRTMTVELIPGLVPEENEETGGMAGSPPGEEGEDTGP